MKDISLLLFIDVFLYSFADFTSFALETNVYDFSHPIIIISIIISLATQLIFRFKKRYILVERFILSLPVFIFSSHYKGVNIMGGVIIIFSAVISCIIAIFLNSAGDKLFCKLSRKKFALVITIIFMICTTVVSLLGAYNQSENYTHTTAIIKGYNYDGVYSYYVDYEDSDGIVHNKVTMWCPSSYEDTEAEIFKEGNNVNIAYPNKNDKKYEYVNLYINYTSIITLASALIILCILLLIKENRIKTEST